MLGRGFQMSAAFAMLAVVAGANLVQGEDRAQTGAGTHYRMKQLLGTTVNMEGDVAIGKVDDVVFDDNGVVEYLIVLNQGKLVTVPWEAAKFNFEKRTAMINIAPEKFKQIPTFTVDQYPVFSTPAYRTQTYQYYGLTPGQARRLDRRLP